MRQTKQRQIIKKLLQGRRDHPDAAKIYNLVRSELPRVSLGTVYRNLELLAELGEIQRLDFRASSSHFDPDPKKHPHFHCLGCGEVEDIPFTLEVKVYQENSNWLSERKVKNYEILVSGYCRNCACEIK